MPSGAWIPWLFAASGWGTFLYNHLTSRPRIGGRVLGLTFGLLRNSGQGPLSDPLITAVLIYPYLVNRGKSAVHIFDYELDLYVAGHWHRLIPAYGVRDVPVSFSDVEGREFRIDDFHRRLLAFQDVAFEFGRPRHGWLLFVGPQRLHGQHAQSLRLTCHDALGGAHTIEVPASEIKSDLRQLYEIAGLRLPGATPLPAPAPASPSATATQPAGTSRVDTVFEDSRVRLDGTRYERCTFMRCTLVFAASAPMSLVGCRFVDCQWVFDGPAGLTVDFLRKFYHGGARAVVDSFLSSPPTAAEGSEQP